MKKIIILLVTLCLNNASFANEALDQSAKLTETLNVLDSELFDAFNHCSVDSELRKHASYFALDVEFYHDNGGVTWDRDSMIANTKNNACGNYSRELIAGTFRAYPIANFGAITTGVHRFCQTANKLCEGKADFVMLWHRNNNKWEVTRVLSYGHRANH